MLGQGQPRLTSLTIYTDQLEACLEYYAQLGFVWQELPAAVAPPDCRAYRARICDGLELELMSATMPNRPPTGSALSLSLTVGHGDRKDLKIGKTYLDHDPDRRLVVLRIVF